MLKCDTSDFGEYLIITNVQNTSVLKKWVEPSSFKNFDLCICRSEKSTINDSCCDYAIEYSGDKKDCYKKILERFDKKLHKYKAIMICEEEAFMDALQIHKMFDIFSTKGLEIAQPAISNRLGYSHISEHCNNFLLRYVEKIYGPISLFTPHLFDKYINSLADSIEDHIDIEQLGVGMRHAAIIDETPVKLRSSSLSNVFKKTSHRWYDGIPKDRKLYFVLLAHEAEDVLEAQLDNIKKFIPNAGVILYNGGRDQSFGTKFRIPICPYSRQIKWAFQARVMWDTMKWLEENKVEYEYLAYLDHDILFVKHGFDQFLDFTMKHYDSMGWQLLKGSDPNKFPDKRLAQQMWKEWLSWKEIFKTQDFLRYFNPVQVYRKRIIQQMLVAVDHQAIEKRFNTTRIFGLEEMFLPTLAMACGGRCREYPGANQYNEAVRWGWDITQDEASRVKRHPYYYWLHPVKGEHLINLHKWLCTEEEG